MVSAQLLWGAALEWGLEVLSIHKSYSSQHGHGTQVCSIRKSEGKEERGENLLRLDIQQAPVVSMQMDTEVTSIWGLSVHLMVLLLQPHMNADAGLPPAKWLQMEGLDT